MFIYDRFFFQSLNLMNHSAGSDISQIKLNLPFSPCLPAAILRGVTQRDLD